MDFLIPEATEEFRSEVLGFGPGLLTRSSIALMFRSSLMSMLNLVETPGTVDAPLPKINSLNVFINISPYCPKRSLKAASTESVSVLLDPNFSTSRFPVPEDKCWSIID